tara:strand:- start:402 stop:980 length:579 start_codon:yes stop_codon:yes gene_type:complete
MSEKEFIAGIDYSLCGPAICISDMNEPFDFYSCEFFFLTNIKKYAKKIKQNITGETFLDYNQEIQRYETIADWAVDKVVGCSRIGLEGYAYNATGKIFHIAENTGVLKYKLYQKSLPVDVFTPSVIKKFATGKGNASKEKMYESFLQETGVPLNSFLGMSRQKTEPQKIKSPVSDIVDSYYICKFLRYEIIV